MSTGDLVTCLVASTVVFRISSMGMEAYDIANGLEAVRASTRCARRPPRAPPNRVPPLPARGRRDTARHPVRGTGLPLPGSERPVLDGLDLRVQPGETVAIVGDSGAGKTTLIKLLAGLYAPTAGRVTVDGTDLASLDAEAWRRRLGVVFQDFNRYPLSLADNVALGAPEHRADLDGVAQALHRADAATLADGLPAKEATWLSGEFHGGVDLSGGQWQRLAIARALFATAHGRDILVLDEPTAHLDVESEAEFHQRVTAAAEDATVVLISHRLSTVRRADRIVRIADGRVVEEGSHDALMAADGGYARLFRLQAARFGKDPAGPAGCRPRARPRRDGRPGPRHREGDAMTTDTGQLAGRASVLRHLMRLTWRTDRTMTLLLTVLMLSQTAAVALTGLSQRWLVDSVGLDALAGLVAAVAAGAVGYALTAACGRIQANLIVDLSDRVDVKINEEVLTAIASIPTMDHLETPEHLNRLGVLRRGTRALSGSAWRLAEAGATVASVVLSVWLLMDVSPSWASSRC
ncbi:ATP-binding cassette domain-containing protein [Streptomyces sp. M19]